ncbi:MAG: hypothetical protein C0467_11170 [Planctomycetaceae bacterium]|nr:hypothetical protein [Planctomycetaceae bacterium]
MSVQSVRCPCRGNPECKLCGGSKFYNYEVGPRGWMPFTCPTCGGAKTLPGNGGGDAQSCLTCHGSATIDPGYPPPSESTGGLLRRLWMIFFGG